VRELSWFRKKEVEVVQRTSWLDYEAQKGFSLFPFLFFLKPFPILVSNLNKDSNLKLTQRNSK
jgi:hypothetical protein